VESVYK